MEMSHTVFAYEAFCMTAMCLFVSGDVHVGFYNLKLAFLVCLAKLPCSLLTVGSLPSCRVNLQVLREREL